MANIIINENCNLRCPYCFASSLLDRSNKEGDISIEQLNIILNWLEKSSSEERIGIIGGEPTLHSHFKDILDIVNKFSELNDRETILFTNGIELYKYFSFLSPKMSVLININNPKDLTTKQQSSLLKTLDIAYIKRLLQGDNPQFTLGCNIYKENENYDFFWRIIKKYQVQRCRVSVTTPNDKESLINKEKYYSSLKKTFLLFVEEAKKYSVQINLDCNNIPICYFNEKEIDLINEVTGFIQDEIINYCDPTIDITPNFQATSCFGLSDIVVNCENFNDCDELRNYFQKKIINKIILDNKNNKCIQCKKFNNMKCQGGCLKFLYNENQK